MLILDTSALQMQMDGVNLSSESGQLYWRRGSQPNPYG